MVLKKETTLFDRDEKGELIEQEVDIIVDKDHPFFKELDGQTVAIVPMTRGEVKKMFSLLRASLTDNDSDIDGDIIVKHCKKPAYTAEEVKHLKGPYATALVDTILYHSGLELKGKTKKQAIEDKEDEFGKN